MVCSNARSITGDRIGWAQPFAHNGDPSIAAASLRFAQCQQIRLFGLLGLQMAIHLVREVVGLSQPAAGRRVGQA